MEGFFRYEFEGLIHGGAYFSKFYGITSVIFAKYHVQIMLLFVFTTTNKRFVIFTCGYFKLS